MLTALAAACKNDKGPPKVGDDNNSVGANAKSDGGRHADAGDDLGIDATPDGSSCVDYYLDQDGDGVGTEATEVTVCDDDPPSGAGWVTVSGDCDDDDAARYPGATEICNGVDDDCENGEDDGLAFTDYWRDEDGDGVGAGEPSAFCEPPTQPGWSTRDGDCADDDPTRNPDAVELCDAVDQNCDAVIDDEADADCPGEARCGGGVCTCAEIPPTWGDRGATCDTAIDLGPFSDLGALATATTNVQTSTGEIWYKFRAIDSYRGVEWQPPGDTNNWGADSFNAVASLIGGDGLFEIAGTTVCSSGVWLTDTTGTSVRVANNWTRVEQGITVGENPCDRTSSVPFSAPGDVNGCTDNSQDIYVVVRRLTPDPADCTSVTLEVSNGIYNAP